MKNCSMILEAIFSDETSEYIHPFEANPFDTVKIRLRVARYDIHWANLVEVRPEHEYNHPMQYESQDEYFDYYSVEIRLNEETFTYYFEISDGQEVKYLSNTGIHDYRIHYHYFRIVPGFKTPVWTKGAIMYQIYIDRFYRSEVSPHVLDDEYIYIGRKVSFVKDWEALPENFDVCRFYGGDLTGVMEKLDYLKSLGVEAIYFNPLFVSPSNHKYDTQDYSHIDPHLTCIVKDGGDVLEANKTNNRTASKYIERTTLQENLEASDAFFAKFVAHAHELGIKVIMDGVFNHCGSFNRWLDREYIYSNAKTFLGGQYPDGAYVSMNSPYREYFRYFGDNVSAYDGWWGHDTLPKLNYENSEALVEEILAVARKWISPPYHVDAWRLDVAADLGHSPEYNHYFWQRFRQAVKEINPDVFILAEHYGDPLPWLNGKEWDSVMNYDAFMEPVSFFLTGLEKHSDRYEGHLLGNGKAFFDMLLSAKSKLPMPALLSAMNQLSNHDHSRFLTRTNKKVGRIGSLGSQAAGEDINKAIFRQAILMQMSLQGAPTLYYGDEAGMVGFTDPDNRRTYPWGKEDHGILDFYRYMIQIHKNSEALRYGSLIKLVGDDNLVVYGRVYKEESMLCIIYTGTEEKELDIPIWLLGYHVGKYTERLIYTDADGYNVGLVKELIEDGYKKVEVKKDTAILYRIGACCDTSEVVEDME